MSTTEWSEENREKLLACITIEDFLNAFPGKNIETLKRRQREFRNGTYVAEEIAEDTKANMQLTGDTGVINSGTVDAPITDWSDTLAIWGLDPEKFEVIEPVTMKAWDAGSGRKFSYRARIQKKVEQVDTESNLDIAGWRKHLREISGRPAKTIYGTDNVSYLILVADPQLGKPGTQEALDNWKRGIEGHLNRVQALKADGTPINELALVFMGDEHEGCVGNYVSQPYEVEMNYSEQIELDFDMRVWSIRQLLEAGLPIQIGSVPSNHGEHTRFGGNKALTSIYDNSSTMVASLVKKVFDGSPVEDALSWSIATDRQDVNLNLNGVKANFTHGHVSRGSGAKTGGISSKNAIEKQILGRHSELSQTDLFYSAHYHHFNVIEDRGRSFFGCPALEAEKSSRWFYDSAGVWSKPGMLGMAVSRMIDRGWSELAVI